jgi:hypothetical protein
VYCFQDEYVREDIDGRKLIHLTDMNLCCRADDVDFDIAFSIITKPTEEPCILQVRVNAPSLIEEIKQTHTMSVISSSLNFLINPSSPKKREASLELSAVFSTRTMACTISPEI